jgi:2-dehydro-3-deoxygluconokinase
MAAASGKAKAAVLPRRCGDCGGETEGPGYRRRRGFCYGGAMRDAVAIGECMVELGLEGAAEAAIGYAGDTFNTAVYLSRLGVSTAYATAVGQGDPFSAGMLSLMGAEGVGRELVVEAEGRLPGIYAIQRDARGERSFYYWRDSAPARDYLALVDRGALAAAARGAKVAYVSAITLAILGDEGRRALQEALAGASVALDTNYRARLWPSPEVARAAVEAFVPLCRTISASAADLEALGAPADAARAWASGCEVVLRHEDRTVEVLAGGRVERFAPEPAVEAVDTTAAGDAFNAAYLAARIRGAAPAQAVRAARRLAGVVVQHPGAIIAASAMPGPG